MTAGISPIGPKYYGSKTIYANEKTLGEYNIIRGWKIPENENPERLGYMVQYEDGYISWSPKEVFESAYRRTDALTFGQAIEHLKAGNKVTRSGWNGRGMYLWLLPEAKVPADWCKEPHLKQLAERNPDGSNTMHCLPSIRMKTADGKVLTGWLASQTDIFAEDWMILD